MMREIYRFCGRDLGPADQDSGCLIETAEGTVLEITEVYGTAEFIVGYCRKALADRWGVCCFEPFKMASDPGMTRTWAKHWPTGLFIFRGARFYLTREEEWMRRKG